MTESNTQPDTPITPQAKSLEDRVLSSLLDEPVTNELTEDELEAFHKARLRSPEEAADVITNMMVRAGTARLPSARDSAPTNNHTVLSQRGYKLRRAQVQRAADAQEFLAEIGPFGICEEISKYGVGGCIKNYNLAPMEFEAWLQANVPEEILEKAEELYAESMLYDAKAVFNRPPVDKVETDYMNHKSKALTELAGLYNRKRARAAPKIDINQVAAAAVEVTVIAASGATLAANREKADRQQAVAKARVAYGTGQYIDPPGLQAWVEGAIQIPDYEIDDYLMLKLVPLAVQDYVETNTRIIQQQESEQPNPEDDPTLLLDDQSATTVHLQPSGGVHIPEHYFEADE